MKRCVEVLVALVSLAAQRAPAQAVKDAARELAGKIAAASAGPASISFRNQSSLAGSRFEEARRALEAELPAAGVRIAPEPAASEIRITVSENVTGYLMVAEVRRGEERRVMMAGWPRSAAAARASATVTLEKKLVWEQNEPVLDFALAETGGVRLLLVLEPARVVVYRASVNGWEPRDSLPIVAPGPLPRDLRGRLAVQAPVFQAYLPGLACRGSLEPAGLDCKAGELLWPLVSGASFAGMAAFNAGRNYFDGGIVAATGTRAALPPFLSMAWGGTAAEPLWILASPDGRTHAYNGALASAGSPAPSFGGDVAGTEARCGSGRQVLAARRGDASEGDELQAWEVSGAQAVPVSAALDFPGPVVALWPAGAAAVSAVVRDPDTGRYGAYFVAIGCGS